MREGRHDVDTGKAIGHCVVDSPWLLVGTLEGITTVTASASGRVGGLVVCCTRLYGAAEIGLAIPPARWFAAVPVPRSHGFARVVEIGGMRKKGKEVEGDESVSDMSRHDLWMCSCECVEEVVDVDGRSR